MYRIITRWLLLVTLAILLPVSSFAQTSSPWSLEASFIYNQKHYDFADVQESIDSRTALEGEDDPPRTVHNERSIEPSWAPDMKIGLTYYNLYLGFLYNSIGEQTVGYDAYLDWGGIQFQPDSYEITSSSREYMITLGYRLPLTDRFSFGVYGSAGWGFAKGKYIDNHPPFAGQPRNEEADITGNYTPWRIEGRLRVALTKYIDIDLGGGWRASKADRMVAEYGLTYANYPVAVYSTSDPKIAEFDWSGPFYGIGITMKNPYGEN